jgi:hypothetical protein
MSIANSNVYVKSEIILTYLPYGLLTSVRNPQSLKKYLETKISSKGINKIVTN